MDSDGSKEPLLPRMPMATYIQLFDKSEGSGNKTSLFRRLLPHIARLCLVSTFIEGSFRIYSESTQLTQYFQHVWHTSEGVASVLVVYQFLSHIVPVFFIMFRYYVGPAVIVLGVTVIVQVILYYIVVTFTFLARDISVFGALILLYAETLEEKKYFLSGSQEVTDNNRPKGYMFCTGRFLLLFMLFSLIEYDTSFLQLLDIVIAIVLLVFVTIGYKTTISSIILVFWLLMLNFILHPYWTSPGGFDDFQKYSFYQTLSVIGGFLLLICYGPGGVSVDYHYKKK
ncbi:unnamed protein product [Bursaphelenchus xylophilus]|uniref:(pine wood nematode) hypothetical protein n=1 Tax=Bursaphelenchus xylophilus TaxID=6326 RepID=A0A1I7SL63_BURXY|nr:surfeit locus protein [Bursaphelenchus xylophilus]CAD5233923.1 unnamed protein product [Bursaphelenchus xylophilus]CAG9129382.1 unnamed protein product [Bursaphelenchus xylophilus]